MRSRLNSRIVFDIEIEVEFRNCFLYLNEDWIQESFLTLKSKLN